MARLTSWDFGNEDIIVNEEEFLLSSKGFIDKDEMYKIMRHLAEKLYEYEEIGTVEEIKEFKDKSLSEWKYFRKENIAVCNNCSYEHYLGTYHQYERKFCPKCGSKMSN